MTDDRGIGRSRIGPMQTPTLRDVAEAAGVHAGTASRALNPETRRLVNVETARRVLRAPESLGYQPNPIARSLKTSKSGTVGLVLPDLTDPLFPPIVRGIEDVLWPGGYSAFIVNTDNDPERERAMVTSLRSRQVEGLIVATSRPSSRATTSSRSVATTCSRSAASPAPARSVWWASTTCPSSTSFSHH